MEESDLKIRKNVIKETFNDNRTIVSSVDIEELNIGEEIHQGGDIFITSDCELIDLEFQFQDFTEDELKKYVCLAEKLYEKYYRKVSIYIICPKDINVCVRESEIKSNAEFTIKLACIPENINDIILNGIKAKIKADEMLDEDDLLALMCLMKNMKN